MWRTRPCFVPQWYLKTRASYSIRVTLYLLNNDIPVSESRCVVRRPSKFAIASRQARVNWKRYFVVFLEQTFSSLWCVSLFGDSSHNVFTLRFVALVLMLLSWNFGFLSIKLDRRLNNFDLQLFKARLELVLDWLFGYHGCHQSNFEQLGAECRSRGLPTTKRP